MKKITYLVLGLLASSAMLHSATFSEASKEVSSSSAARPLQVIFDTHQHDIIERRIDTPNCFQDSGFSSLYKRHNIRITDFIHQQAHLWPDQYRKSAFKHGLLNEFIDFYSGYLKITSGKESDNLKNRLFVSPLFAKGTKDPQVFETRLKMASELWTAFQEGLQQNEQLLLIGSNYLKHKIREEVISTGKKEGQFLDVLELEKQEKARGDLLQDLAWTITRRASEIMCSTIRKAIKDDAEFQALIVEKEQFESQYPEGLSEVLKDAEFMAEYGVSYTDCLARFEEYKQATREFFETYTPVISGIDSVEFQALELIDLGAEDVNTVPRNLRAVVEAEMSRTSASLEP